MKVLVRLYSWEDPGIYSSNLEVSKGDKVVAVTPYASELGVVEETKVSSKNDIAGEILRVATTKDKETFFENEKRKEELIEKCKETVKKYNLEMKVVDARISLDDKQVIFTFTADGRIDFRELVKDLSRDLKKAVRMQQIGSRDEARKLGGYGVCGRSLCCSNFSGSLQSITTDMARIQQIAHRGTDRISGLCGRLMCCLAYEAEQYKQMMAGMPEIYSVIETREGRGTVVEVNAVSQAIKIKTEKGEYITIKKEDIR
ncbi:MAG: hypothetical protein A2288_02575 [Candidatus Moranbacteria bacterium RIFOXYA12_FULL_44_15]|nr:MAG: hypothetical protein A2288_02575 [Candidatus Moranbacteria bacterium RIFOXYA12_FULL_44_15]OGI35538.1 MAG: hypothetical protein A2259_00210 [Candidatus Moranbacteria bacterium RIFOXYA2_FULL_43_15]